MNRLRVVAVTLLAPLLSGQILAQQVAGSSVELVGTFRGHTKTIQDIQFSHNGEMLATNSDDRTVRLWSTANGQQLATITGDKGTEPFALSWSPDDRRLAITYRGKKSWALAIWEVPPGQQPVISQRIEETYLYEWSPNGLTFLTLDQQLALNVWDVGSGKLLHQMLPALPKDQIANVSYVANGWRIMTASENGPIQLWDVATGKLVAAFPPSASFPGVTYLSPKVPLISLDKRLLLSDSVNLYEAETGQLLKTLKGEGNPVSFNPQGDAVLTIRNQDEKTIFDGKHFLSLRKIDSGQELAVFQIPVGISDIYWSPDGRTIAIVGLEFHTRLIDTATGRENGRLPYGNCWPWQLCGSDNCEPLQFSADGALLLKEKEPIKLWDTQNAALVQILKSTHLPAAFSPVDGQILATSSADKKSVLLWRLKPGKTNSSSAIGGRKPF